MAIKAWAAVFPNGRGLLNGAHLNALFTAQQQISAINVSGNATVGSLTTTGAVINNGPVFNGISTVVATGATQGTARAISATANTVYVSVSASTEGVKLPTAATGRAVTIFASPTVGVKVYGAAAGQSIGAGTTATTATLVPKLTSVTFQAISKTKWYVS